jgi:hypothetical protein
MGPTNKLLHTDCFGRAGINANSAINAGVCVNLRLIVGHAYRIARALLHAGLATSTLFIVNFSRHPYHPFKKRLNTYEPRNGMLQNYGNITIQICHDSRTKLLKVLVDC